ncbi:MAG TPA: IclR family transcriptional regulator C-terminal domain-containing protein [Stenotrophomonas sp.]|nr:IclR family transcriptional regulator C-terminal domain-containing protein [Stenotrophomonas sp.]
MRTRANAQPNESLIDGIATLQALATTQEPVGCLELARRLDAEPTRINRLLKALAYTGIVRQTADRKYTVGAGMHVLAAQSLFASGLVRRALPVLESLKRYGHTVAMGMLWQDNVSFVFHAPPGVDAMNGLGRVGLFPAANRGVGVALLAQLSDAEVRELYENRRQPATPVNLDALLETLAQTRQQGYARMQAADDGEHHVIARPVGTPVYAAIALKGWIPESATAELVAAMQSGAHEIG